MDILSQLGEIFTGFSVLAHSPWQTTCVRILLVFLGFLMIYLGRKGILEALLMIPMGLGMAVINVSGMFFDPVAILEGKTPDPQKIGTLFLDSTVSDNMQLMSLMQVDWLQPIYTLAFSNGLIACLIFVGIGSLLDIGFVMARPYVSMFLALFAELGTFLTLPIAAIFYPDLGKAASIALVGGADGPMVLFGSLKMAPDLFVPITIVAYLYLGLCYGGYPYLVKLLIPKKLIGLKMPPEKPRKPITSGQKIVFAAVASAVLSFLFPVASPLIFSLFLGITIRESGLEKFLYIVSEIVLYGSTLMLGLLLGVLCEAETIMKPEVLPLLLLGILSLLLSGIGGIIGGYAMYFLSGRKFNPVIGLAGVSCVPSCAKVAQKCVAKVNPGSIIMPYALGANICGVITTAIIAAVYMSLIK